MKRLLLLPIALLALTGCATYTVKLKDESPNERIITADITLTTWFSSATTIEKFKAIQTDKTQSVGSTGLTQHGATNFVEALDKNSEDCGGDEADTVKGLRWQESRKQPCGE